MGSFVFKWDHPANEVYVTGTFDDWAKSVKLDKTGTGHKKKVDLPEVDEKIFYKFVVDGNWTTDHTAPQEDDGHNNINNVLLPENITKTHTAKPDHSSDVGIMSSVTPTSTTAGLAGQVPKETQSREPTSAAISSASPQSTTAGLAGNVPKETQSQEPTSATAGLAGNVPKETHPREPTSSAISSASPESTNAGLAGDVPKETHPKEPTSATISSAAPTSTTAGLAGNVPKEPQSNEPKSANISSAAPDSTTTELAKDAPVEDRPTSSSSAMPGIFPETPSTEPSEFSVNPIPATSGAGNPIALAPGETVPDPSTLTSNTTQSTVHDDISLARSADDAQQIFGVGPLPATEGAGNPINLKAGEKVPKPDEFTSNTIHSNVTTDKESYENSGAALSGAPRLPGDDSQQTFGVAPLPATSGAGNPISLRPGEKVPNPSSFTANTIRSGITTDEESYEKGSATSGAPQLPDVVTPQKERDQRGGGLFGLPPVSGNMIPESSLPMGAGPASEPDPGFTIQSAGPATSTAELAGKVPLEPTDRSEGVPQIVKESQEKAHVDPEASGSPELVKEKSTMEQELKREVESEPVTSEGAALAHRGKSEPSAPASGVPDVVQDSQHQAHADPEASSSPVAVKEKSAMENELRSIVQPEPATSEGADVVGGSTSNPTGAAAGVPEVVQDSQQRAHADPEASSSPVAVQEKSAMEDELRSIVQPEPATSDAVAVAGGSSSSKPIGAAAGVPEVVQDSQQRAHVDPEASSSPVAVQEKSAMEEELQSKIPQEPTVAEGTSRENGGSTDKDESALSGGEIMGVAAGGAAIGGITAAGLSAPDQPSLYGHSRDLGSGYLPPSIQQSINEINSSYKGTTTSTLVPDVVQQSISTSHQSPEAPSNQEAVAEKSALERELLSELKPAPVSSESAPDTGATSTMGASSTPSAGVPEVVQGSITKSHQSPGAAANKEAVAEKQAMEDELLRKIPSEEAAGEPAPPFSSAVVSLAPAPTISTTASAAPIDTSMPATTGTKNMTEETPLTSATVTSPSEDGLAAPAAMPAMTPTTKQVEQQKAATDSRDVSPMSKRVGTDTQTQPTVTTGVGESKTEGVSKSAPQDVSTPAPKQDVSTPAPKTTSASKTTPVGTGGGSSSAAAVRQSSPGSAKTAESTTSDKKAKRRSFFGKLKDKLK